MRFNFRSDGSVRNAGWYIDGICVTTANNTADHNALFDFEGTTSGFIMEGNTTFAWGTPTSGPGSAHGGNELWATNLTGNYSNYEDGSIISPIIDMTALGSATLTWWEWYQGEDISVDNIRVQASTNGGGSWTTIYGPYDQGDSQTSASWNQRSIYLNSSYMVSNFRLKFQFLSDGSNTRAGWYIDDISIGGTTQYVFDICEP